MKKALCLLIFLYSQTTFSQPKARLLSVRQFFVIDSIPLINLPKGDSGFIPDSMIHSKSVTKDKVLMKKYGLETTDEIVLVITKACFHRPDSIKKIPSLSSMDVVMAGSSKYHLKGNKNPYSGPFIDYFLNGSLRMKGTLKDGRLVGNGVEYYENRKLKNTIQFKDGFLDGWQEEFYETGKMKSKIFYRHYNMDSISRYWFSNGQLKDEVIRKNSKMHGERTEWYSTGMIKQQTLYSNNQPFYTPQQQRRIEDKSGYSDKKLLQLLNKYIAEDSTYTGFYFSKANVCVRMQMFDEAIASLTKVIEIEPLETGAYYQRVRALVLKYENVEKPRRYRKKELIEDVMATEMSDAALKMLCADILFIKNNDENSHYYPNLDKIETKYCK